MTGEIYPTGHFSDYVSLISMLIKAGEEVGSDNFSLYSRKTNGSTRALAVMNMFLHGFDNATIRWGDTIRNPKLKEGDALMKFNTVVANPPFSLDKWGKSDDKEENKSSDSFDSDTDKYNRFWRGNPPDFLIGSTILTTNQLGYVIYNECPGFDTKKIITILND